jgi:hypothetical protein
MLGSLIRVRTAWEYYFPIYFPYYGSNLYTTVQVFSDTNLYIKDCLFSSITSTNYGGALNCGKSTCVLIDSTSFFSCRTNCSGGALMISGKGQCVLYKVCGYNCTITNPSTTFYIFAYISVNDTASSINNFNYSSIAQCEKEESSSHYILQLAQGKKS